jgi:PAS domain S-box-containing protein
MLQMCTDNHLFNAVSMTKPLLPWLKGLKIRAAIVLGVLCWAFIADPLISSLARYLEPKHQDIFRSINDFIVALLVAFVLYKKIRKQQLELRKAAADYRQLFEENPAPMYIFDAESFQFLTVNTAALKQYDYTRDEFLDLKATDIQPAAEWQSFLDINGHNPDNYFDAGRWLHQNKSGQQFYVHVYAYSTFFEGKAAKLALAINIDLKIKTERALQKKTAELENVLESITDAFYTVDRDWNFTYINKEYERIQNRKREDLLGKNVWKHFPYGKELCFYKKYSYALQEQVSVHFEEYNPDNEMWVSAHAYPTENGLAIYFRDITEEKQLREKIYRDSQNLRAIINNTKDLIWSVDCKFNIIIGNQAFWERVELLTGKTEQNITNTDFEQGMMKPVLDSYDLAFKGEAFRIVRQREIEGEVRFEELSFNPIYDQQHHVIGINCFLRDITEQQQYIEQIKQQNAKLLEIAWIQSHKVRGPVANLLGLARMLESDPDPAIIEKIKEAALHMDEVIREITAQTAGLDRKK